KGVAIDLGNALAQRLVVPFDAVTYSSVPALMAGAKSGEWDVALLGMSPERATAMDFSGPYMEIEHGYLVRDGAAIKTAADVDVAGRRVGVLNKSAADVLLSQTLKNATLVRTESINALYSLLGSGGADVIASGKTGLFATAGNN